MDRTQLAESSADEAAGSSSQPPALTLAPEHRNVLLRLYRDMVLVRRFEEKVAEMYTRARIGGYTHLNIGEEATIVGALSALRPRDYVFANYREHGYALVRGVPAGSIMAELFGKETGTSLGRGGSMHIFDARQRFMGGYAIVGASLPLAAGVGFAVNYRRGDEVVMAAFGEGSANIGAFHETLNLAKLWKLPVFFLCVNNQYAMGDRPEQDAAVPEVYRRACAYDMIGERVDGMDVLAVYNTTARLVQHTRRNHDPVLLESVCYRMRGHSMADPARYRSAEELKSWMERDPIARFQEALERAGLMSPDDARRVESEVHELVSEAVEIAERGAFPDPAELGKYTYSEQPTRGAAS
jgi:pyruvate dehydrogenase E1 component alpha subunit